MKQKVLFRRFRFRADAEKMMLPIKLKFSFNSDSRKSTPEDSLEKFQKLFLNLCSRSKRFQREVQWRLPRIARFSAEEAAG